jgi:hypothetical protein
MNGAATVSVPCGEVVCALLSDFVVASTPVGAVARVSMIVIGVSSVEDVVMGYRLSEIPMSGSKAVAVSVVYSVVNRFSLQYLRVK